MPFRCPRWFSEVPFSSAFLVSALSQSVKITSYPLVHSHQVETLFFFKTWSAPGTTPICKYTLRCDVLVALPVASFL